MLAVTEGALGVDRVEAGSPGRVVAVWRGPVKEEAKVVLVRGMELKVRGGGSKTVVMVVVSTVVVVVVVAEMMMVAVALAVIAEPVFVVTAEDFA